MRIVAATSTDRVSHAGRWRAPVAGATLRLPLFALVLLAIAAAGCTTVPTREFATYKETFAKARAAGEEVILDYGAAAAHRADLKAAEDAAKAGRKKRGEPFDAGAAGRDAAARDRVVVRMKAWDVVARYNDLLTALAEGRAADELAGAVDGLSSSLGSFPIATVAVAWTEVSGYLAPLKPLALEAVRERSRRDFIAAVGKGGPLIADKFLKLLREDTVQFYDTRRGLNDLELGPLVDAANATGRDILASAGRFQATPEIDDALKQLNTAIDRVPFETTETRLVREVRIKQHGPGAPTPEVRVQILTLVREATAQAGKVAAKDAELRAYRDVLNAYLALLDQLEHSMRGLQAAAEQAQPGIPQAADLERTVILLREAYMTYKDKRKD
jgi:hypothetical protein